MIMHLKTKIGPLYIYNYTVLMVLVKLKVVRVGDETTDAKPCTLRYSLSCRGELGKNVVIILTLSIQHCRSSEEGNQDCI